MKVFIKKIFVITAIIGGILLILQIRSFKKVEFLIQRSGPESVLGEMRKFQLANQQLREQIAEEEKNAAEAVSKLGSQAVEEEINKLRMLSGDADVWGEGVELSFNLPIKAFWISDIIAHLVGVGTEAVAINGIRLIPATAGFRDVGGGLVMRRQFLRPPFKISAIGPKDVLKTAINQNGGIMDRIKNSYPNISLVLEQKDKIFIPALVQ